MQRKLKLARITKGECLQYVGISILLNLEYCLLGLVSTVLLVEGEGNSQAVCH